MTGTVGILNVGAGDTDAPFWSDGFDIDLPKIFPDARRLLGDLGEIELVTLGTRDPRTRRLNHPAVWNADRTMLAFFGFKHPARDPAYAAPGAAEIRCTAWEAFRDAWPHAYLIVVERRPVWDTFALRPQFDAILHQVRGWPATRLDPQRARAEVKRSYCAAVLAFGRVVGRHGAAARAAS